MDFRFSAEVFQWRGPAPFFYAAVPDEHSEAIRAEANQVSYGWGVIPVRVLLGRTEWETSLFPKDGRYLVPLKAAVRRAERIDDGDVIDVALTLAPRHGAPVER